MVQTETGKKEKVAVVGLGPSTRHQAPFFDDSFEIWGLNYGHYLYFPRFDRWFQMHDRQLLERRDKRHIEWLKRCKTTVYMQERYSDISASVAYPTGEMVSQFGNHFNNTFTYMLALAIYEEFGEIHIFGVSGAGGYKDQGISLAYFIGVARGRGIRVVIPDDSNLLSPEPLYGPRSSLEQEMELRIHSLQTRRRKLQSDLAFVDGLLGQAQQVTELSGEAADWRDQRKKPDYRLEPSNRCAPGVSALGESAGQQP